MASLMLVVTAALRLVKPGGRIPEKGKKITVLVKNIDDLSRDVIKSDTASVKVTELDLELTRGTLGGLVTTVEGLITKVSGRHDMFSKIDCRHFLTFEDDIGLPNSLISSI
ncbi:ZPR1 zinc-finger domain protein [Actinidia rufa]|uniref:ZPR1 zinc-finger domain protein n=1 Tax=Actinidia rufa TaxID=165716 RepID=A0A7J0EMB3_9ERIC|nr:ZPR1 zinc-finger domain protein [Actinidia rufa]